ncbi:MAG: transglutaminase domain-containing protein, partial [Planctomycetes bacterium]|nr:transglutaminase domain-containing protein [Planctomycetota bacterium]
PAPGDDCLDASSATDVRLRELADRLRVGADPAERVRRTLAYLRSNCSYSLNVGVFRSADPVGEFVFDKRRGYCEYFASAAALLLRMQGVPSRYVVGYSVRPSNLEGGHYVVREADAHAWVEAWIAGRGWVEIDPTPAAQFEAMREPVRGGALAGHWERLKGWIAEAGAMIRQGGILAALGRWGLRAIVGAALIGLAAWLLRAGRRFSTGRRRAPALAADGSGGIPTELLDLMARLDRLWKRAGHPRPAARAPLEHLRGLPPAARLGGELVDAFYRCRYGGAAPTSEELAVLRRALPRG